MSVSSSNTLLADHSSTWTPVENRKALLPSETPGASHQRLPHLPPPGLTVVQVAEVEDSQQQVGEVEIFVEGLEEKENS